MVLQDVWLFSGTIRDNIAYGYNVLKGKEATEEEIVAAAKMAYVDHFVQTLPHGYDTVINDDATQHLSGTEAADDHCKSVSLRSQHSDSGRGHLLGRYPH